MELYCRSAPETCERFKLRKAGITPSSNLLPNGAHWTGPREAGGSSPGSTAPESHRERPEVPSSRGPRGAGKPTQ